MASPSDREKSIFLEAAEIAPQVERGAYLDRACGNDLELRAQVAALLAAHERRQPLLDVTEDQRHFEPLGTQIGPYKLLQQIGEGGMGVVYMAEQEQPVRRKVALKVIKPGMDTREVVARFEAERQALAIMDHPNIAKVLDGGATPSGRPYFVMELVKGAPITDYCDQHHLTPRQRLELFVPVCQAIQHAHQKGIIHRDLKPSNVLVALYDSQPVPKVIDFGVAKAAGQPLTEQTLVTGFGAIVGTPEYMSPEQAGINQLDIDTRSDIYSLGVLLYELLAGSPPFSRKELEKAGMLEMLRVIREQEPSKPSTKLSTAEGLPTLAANRGTEPARLTKLVRGELDWIVMKALEKDRNRRYETANGFAMDVQRYLADEPVQACPPSAGYRLRKFVRRNKRALLTMAVVAIAVLLAAGSVGWAVRDRKTREQDAARDRAARQMVLKREVDGALKESESAYGRDKLPEALEAVKRAEGLLAGGDASPELEQRVRRLRSDLEMVAQLEEANLALSGVKDDRFDFSQADQLYAKAFRDYGIDPDRLEPDEAAEFIRHRSIRVPLATALDGWARVRRFDLRMKPAQWMRLLEVSQRADPDPWRNELREAWMLNDRKALQKLTGSEQLVSQPPISLVLLGDALESLGAKQETLDLLRRARGVYPADFWINHQLGLYSLKSQRWDDAVRFLTAAQSIRPQSPGVHVNLGVALKGKGEREEAKSAYRRAIQLKPDYAMAYSNLGGTLRVDGELDKAVVALKEALRHKPKDANTFVLLGAALHQRWRLDESIAAYEEAVRIQPNHYWAWNHLGNPLRDNGQLDEAIAAFEKSIRIKSDLASPHFNLAETLWLKDDRAAAIATARKGLDMPQSDLEARPCSNLSLWLAAEPEAKHFDPELAVRLAERAVATEPKVGYHWTRLGVARYRAKDWTAAISALDKAVEIYGVDTTQEWFFLAMAHWQLGDKVRGRQAFVQAVRSVEKAQQQEWLKRNKVHADNLRLFRAEAEKLFGPDEVQAALDRSKTVVEDARLHARARQWAEAVPLYKEAQEWQPHDDALWFEYALVLLLSGDEESFRKFRAEVLKRAELRPHFKARLPGLAPVDVAEAEKAADLAEKLLAANPHMITSNNAGVACYRAGQFGAAVKHFHHSLELGSGSPRVMNFAGLALAYQGLGQTAEAKQWLAKAVAYDRDVGDGDKMHIHHWLSFQVLLREAEQVVGGNERGELKESK